MIDTTKRAMALWLIMLLALVMLATAVHPLFALQNELEGERALLGIPHASKTVAQPQALAGGTLDYTLIISNSGNTAITSMVMTDTLPGALTYVPDSFDDSVQMQAFGSGSVTGAVISWSGSIGPNGYVQILFSATISDGVMVGEVITNTAVVNADGDILSPFAVTEIVTGVVDLSSSTKGVDLAMAEPGSDLLYTIQISNSGAVDAPAVMMTDTLPTDLSYVAGSLTATGGSFAVDGNVITWNGAVAAGAMVQIQFRANIADDAAPDTTLVNTAEISSDGALLTRSVTTTVIPRTPTTLYLPALFKPLPIVTVQATRPNSSNHWRVSWNDLGGGITYELQEAGSADFNGATTFVMGSEVFRDITNHTPSLNNIYYYRTRAKSGDVYGPWSNLVVVRGGWHDDFNNPASGWTMRRTTYLEGTNIYYGTGNEAGYLVAIVSDRWDWVLGSPLVPAPTPPYVIEYRSRVHDASNLVSGGIVLGGDWNGGGCPDPVNLYQTTNCFNHFYNFNYIFYGPLKLLFEDVDQLVWCPNCGGSPLKRVGDYTEADAFDVFPNGPAEEWHTYRVEVRHDDLRLYIDGQFKRSFTDNEAWWRTGPYFGVFASTDEYKPSIWLYDYFKVTYLD